MKKLKKFFDKLPGQIVAKYEQVFQLDTSSFARRKRARKFFIFAMLFIPMLHFFVFFVYVNINTIVLSFQRYDYNLGENIFVAFQNYRTVIKNLLTTDQLRVAIINSLIYFPVNNLIIIPLSTITAYFMYRKVPGRNIFRVIFFLPSIISIVVLTMAFQFMFDPLFGPMNDIIKSFGIDLPEGGWFGNPDTVMPMVYFYSVWAGIGFNMVLLNGAISRIPKEIIESARIDGIGMFKELTQIIVPMIWPTITTLFVVGTTVIFTMFLQSLLLAGGGPSGASKTVAYIVVEMVQTGNLTEAATFGVIFSIIGIPIILLVKNLMERIGQSVEY